MAYFDVASYRKIVEEKKSLYQAAQSRRGEKLIDSKSRDELVTEHRLHLADGKLLALRLGSSVPTPLRHMIVAPPYRPSNTPLVDLVKLPLSDMLLETHHRGHYVLVRTPEGPYANLGISTVIEDEWSNAQLLQLHYQLSPQVPWETAEMILPAGSVIAVKEPYLNACFDGGYCVRVDHVSDIVWLADDDERVPSAWRVGQPNKTADDFRQEGNFAFRSGNYRLATQKSVHYNSARCLPSAAVADYTFHFIPDTRLHSSALLLPMRFMESV
jgi:hypothetical protein